MSLSLAPRAMNPAPSAPLILVVEDEPQLARIEADYLQAAGYAAHIVDHGLAVMPAVQAHAPALIVLDLMLPGRDGLSLCTDLRQSGGTAAHTPIIMVTARVEEVDRLLGLDSGADDYLCKPFSPRELVARVRSILRRARPEPDPAGSAATLAPGATQSARLAGRASDPPSAGAGLCIEPGQHRATAHGQALDLTPAEFRLLGLLVGQPGRVFSRDRLLDGLHDDQRALSDRTVDSHIKNLRRKLEPHWPGQELIRSIYGVGYKYQAPDGD